MFDLVQKKKRLIQVVLFIVTLPFLFFGIDSYFRSGGGSASVASVGGQHISQQEFAQALRERQESIQRLTGGRAPRDLLDSAELRYEVVNALVQRHLLLQRARRANLVITDSELQSVISGLPALQENGRFSYQRYEQFLRGQGMTPAMFEARLRQDLLVRQIDDAFTDSGFVPRTVVDRVVRLSEQKRELSTFTLPADRFSGQIKLEADATKKYYETHRQEFRIPEQARAAYATLSVDSLLSGIKLDPDEAKKYYDANRSQFETPEERRASHILISVEPGADAAAKQKARAQAESLYQQLKKEPEKFAELARQYSKDPSSAAKGGDLGFFPRGTTPKAFEDAVFAMKVGEISQPVESVDGFEIIRLSDIRPGKSRSFEEARSEIENSLKRERAQRKFAEVAEQFSNAAFEQPDSLKPAAEIARASVQQSGWITREHASEPQLNNEKLLQAIFSDDVLNNHRNTEAIEVKPGVLVAARVVEHKPAAERPFEEVKAEIEKKLIAQRAAQLAAQEGRARVEKLKQGKDADVGWNAPRLVGRADVKEVSEPVLREAFRMDASKVPAYGGVGNADGGFTLIRVSKVVEPEKIEAQRSKQFGDALRRLVGQEEMLAYLASLKEKGDVTLSKTLLDKNVDER